MNWWVQNTLDAGGPLLLTSWIVWVVGSIVLHELGHGVVALRCGDDTPRAMGHMTLNPLVHIPPFAWLLFAVLGITWGQMPVNPSAFRRRYDDALVSIAGPLVNVGLALFAGALAGLLLVVGEGITEPLRSNLLDFLLMGATLNVALALFNMIPVPPLDGFQVLRTFVPAVDRLGRGSEASAVAMIILFLLMFMFAGRIIFPVAGEASGELVRAVADLLGGARWQPS